MGEQSVFERCGGFSAVRKVVSSFYEEVLDSPNLAPYFEGSDMASLIDHQTQFMSFVMGGPSSISDEVLRRAHASIGISKAHFDELIAVLASVLEEHDIEPEDVDHVIGEMNSREHLIVSAAAPGSP